MAQTHTFKLPSGVECEVKELTGKHQRVLTEQGGKKTHADRLNDMLADVIIRVGSETNIDEKFLENMLACDKKKALVEVRQFTLGFQKEFIFTYKYVDENGEKQEVEMEIPIEDGMFPFEPMKVVGEKGNLVPASFKEYSDIKKEVTIKLPRSGEEVAFTHLDGKGEIIGASTKKNARSSHTIIKMRRPVRFEKKEKGNAIPIQINLDNLAYLDLEEIRKQIKAHEGRVDTEVMFEHPEAETKTGDDKNVIIDLIGTVAFFFPSEAI